MSTVRNAAGSMTRAMTAVRASNPAPRILRVAVIEDGHVREERLVRDADEVTVGSDPDCTFVVRSEGASEPASERAAVLARRGANWRLSLGACVEGRVQRDSTLEDLSDLRARGDREIDLTEDSRGRVRVAGVTLLFQFVVAPPVATQGKIPASIMRRPMRELDWGYNACLAGFCAFAFAGLGYVEFGYDPIAESLDVREEIRMVQLSAPPAATEPAAAAEPTPAQGSASRETPSPTPSSAARAPRHAPRAPSSAPTPEASSRDADRAALAAARAAEAAMRSFENNVAFRNLATALGPGSAADVIREGRTLSDQSVEAMASVTQVTQGSNEGTSLRRPGLLASNVRGPGQLSERPLEHAEINANQVVTVERVIRPPVISFPSPPSDPSVPQDVMRQIVAVFRRNIGAVQSCYTAGLRNNPSLRGRLEVAFTIGTSGRVVGTPSVQGLDNGDGVHQCVAQRVRYYVFPTLSESADMSFPVNLTPGG
jgi:hypothetical protein